MYISLSLMSDADDSIGSFGSVRFNRTSLRQDEYENEENRTGRDRTGQDSADSNCSIRYYNLEWYEIEKATIMNMGVDYVQRS